jgi:hypothetical protein
MCTCVHMYLSAGVLVHIRNLIETGVASGNIRAYLCSPPPPPLPPPTSTRLAPFSSVPSLGALLP